MDLHNPINWNVRCREVMAERDKDRNALLWAFDRLSVDDMTKRERQQTMLGIGNVLTGKPSPAATYVPNEWADSINVLRTKTT